MSGTVYVNYKRPLLYPLQEQALFDPHRYSIIEASTKSGKTTGAIAWLMEQAMMGHVGQNFWWVAPVYGQAKIAYRRMRLTIPRDLHKTNEQELTITLINGSVLWFKSADRPDDLFGDDVFAAVIDEASRVKAEGWHAVRSTLTATRGPVRIIGNVKGKKNWFYKLARRAEGGDPDMGYHHITASDAVEAGVLNAEEIESAKRDLPEKVYQELYEAKASDDDGNPFGIEHIASCVRELSHLPPVVYGVDLAKSRDWAVIIGLDVDGNTSEFQRWKSPWKETIARIRELPKICWIDSTGVGDPIVEDLQRSGMPLTSYKFSSGSKQQLMEGLAVAIQTGKIGFPEGPIRTELEEFEYQYTRTGVKYSAPEGLHDDCVCALALAWEGYRTIRMSFQDMKESSRRPEEVPNVPTKRDPFPEPIREEERHRVIVRQRLTR